MGLIVVVVSAPEQQQEQHLAHTQPRYTVLTCDLFPEDSLDFIWTGKDPSLPGGRPIQPQAKARRIQILSRALVRSPQRCDVSTGHNGKIFVFIKIILRRDNELADLCEHATGRPDGLVHT